MLDGTHYVRKLYNIHKNKDIYVGIAKYVESRSDASNFELDRPLQKKAKNKKVIGLIKDKLGGKIMKELAGFRAKT